MEVLVIRRIKAVYRDGAFVPEEPCDLPEETHVELSIEGSTVLPPLVTDAEERRRIVEDVTRRMRENPIQPGAPRLTRDDLHARR